MIRRIGQWFCGHTWNYTFGPSGVVYARCGKRKR